MAGILALDIATIVGYAVEVSDRPPFLGHKSFLGMGGGGAQALAFRLWLRDLLLAWCPERVVFEAPIPPRFQTTKTARLTFGLALVAEMVCAELHVPIAQIESQTARAFFTGSGRGKNAKGRVIHECQKRGWDPSDDNAADAACILAWAVDAYHPRNEARRAAIGNPARLL